ncbi:hypothetical protein JDV02_001928 [Purpureocillium takamizusanense]|uniref:Plethodontid modulating factor n=1 Tax=Purpureocillium takamizusanense TaxID=2060973 RepID=A0A9Q8QAJ5_9HYPO|nr:uncharacterized protein JDV02_001928 [Purpureocillium takamizusanense]UNI15391.1 hypothetical protein JDV02_001928 [Purpureocillium takamizusanense]
MKAHAFISVSLLAMLRAAEACKCFQGTKVMEVQTDYCCLEKGGYPTKDHDCPASQISDKLSAFATCCKEEHYTSDCKCPRGC